MKKLLYSLFALITIVACTDDGGVDNGGDSPSPSITLSTASLSFASDNSEATISLISTNAWSAEVTEGSDWCTINPTSGAAGPAKITVTIASNESYEDRSATIVIKAGDIEKSVTIKQMQKGAIIVAYSEYEFDHTGGELDFEIQTNVDFTVTTSNNASGWIHQVDTRALEIKTLHFNISANSREDDREGTITISGGNATQTITIKQSGLKEILKKEREALIALYNATSGDNWTNNENWCSDKPVSEWKGVYVHDNGTVQHLFLSYNNLVGTIPPEIGDLQHLCVFDLLWNDLSGEIPEELYSIPTLESIQLTGNHLTGKLSPAVGNLKNLGQLWLGNNSLVGDIPAEISNLSNLEELFLGNIMASAIAGADGSGTGITIYYDSTQVNKFTGQLPRDISRLSKLRQFDVQANQLSGTIPEGLWDIPTLEWAELNTNFFEGEITSAIGNAKNLTVLSLGNNHLSGTLPKELGKLSRLDQFGVGNVDYSYSGAVLEMDPNTQWNTLSGDIPAELSYLDNLTLLSLMNNNFTGGFPTYLIDIPSLYETPYLAGNRLSGTIPDEVLESDKWRWWNVTTYILPQQEGYGFDLDNSDIYTSTDYSKDGEVKQLQTATKGDGIDIVLMGDAYSDRLIADGTYDNAMNTAMEKFFAVEPYKSFRDHFNVYSVTAVSQNEVYSDAASTVFEGYFGEGTHVGGNNEKVFDYATKAISADLIDEALIVVMMNSPVYAGTCYMYGPSEGDWGDGASVSYFPVGVNDEALAQVLHHEAGGHGFAKLGDEYAYQENGIISGSEIADAQNMATYGWWKNVDFTNDPTAVKWSHFLSDARYASDGLGVYEGAFTYWTGAYRPTYNSIMNTNVGGFNAPSREAIYYRIHKLAYGSAWQYDYEEFVEWDAKNRVTSSAAYGIPYRLNVPENFKPLHPPVVIKGSWRDAKNNAPTKPKVKNRSQNSPSKSQLSATTALRNGTVRVITVDESGRKKIVQSKSQK